MSVIARMALRAERMASQIAFEASVHAVAVARGLDPQAVMAGRRDGPRRGHRGQFLRHGDGGSARQEALYLTHAVFGRSLRSVARVTGLSPPGVLKAVRSVEDRRDDGGADRRLDDMELILMAGGAS